MSDILDPPLHLMDATIEGADLIVITDQGSPFKFNIREITNFELKHMPTNGGAGSSPDLICAYVGRRDLAGKDASAPRGVVRHFVGMFRDTEKMNGVRQTFEAIGAPVVEF